MAETAERVSAEFILGGQRSGKSRRAESLAMQWLALGADRHAVMVATASAHDEEMRERIRRHQADRAERLPRMETIEASRHVAAVLRARADARTLVVVDCLTLWLTAWLMPHGDADPADVATEAAALAAETEELLAAIHTARGPVVLVGNEIGLGVIPMGREVRQFVDALGRLNQQVAGVCDRVTLMVAGQPLAVKRADETSCCNEPSGSVAGPLKTRP